MGVNTHGYVNRAVSASDIYNVILEKFNKDAIFDIDIRNNYKGEPEEIGHIIFNNGEDQRRLFICYGEVDKESQNSHMAFNGNNKYTYLSLGYWGNSEQIMVDIIKCFGGYVDGNDCDNISAFYVPQAENFDFTEYIKQRKNIIDVLEGLSEPLKIQIASQVLKHKEKIKTII